MWGNVLKNDLGLSDEVTVELLSGPEHGHLMLNEDGSFDYVPFDGFVGKDVFQYNVINDSGKSSVGELCIFIEDDGGDGDDEPSGSNKSGKDDSGKSGSNKSGKDGSGKSGSNKSGKSGAKKLGKNGKRKH